MLRGRWVSYSVQVQPFHLPASEIGYRGEVHISTCENDSSIPNGLRCKDMWCLCEVCRLVGLEFGEADLG